MADPISFTSASPRFGLPFLFPGQAQKEFFVNEAHALADLLLHPAIEGEAGTPPANPADGECWLVAAGASDGWAGHDGELACHQAGNWIFATPRNGMTVLDQAAGQLRRYADGWHMASTVAEPSGGSVVDTEARAAITGLIAALVAAAILPDT
ncbi:DUF2793 domain-containing protein [Alteraurantiacibacter aquimixticola]|uniref:DUF2793 domain-containing protein n=1 Tax=Alteraurantiacibacter aquimixticola TaxID=2489173 RepID=A0A4T3F3U8_9SPHN|nr:DUF2793 domain-containing protein [Alteraurantiacibacter aquimixticola]TIX49373.1 DUF2793 domain-containing protein [Alteraurantiacibacter aquimixticola]